jgi:CBS domain-containing protein
MSSTSAGALADKAYITLDENTLVAQGAKTLYEQEGNTIVVTRDAGAGRRSPVGIVTERDIIFRVVAQNKGPFKVSLKDIMSSPLISIRSDTPEKQALSILKEKKINRLCVLNESGELEGLLTTEMIAKGSLQDATTKT